MRGGETKIFKMGGKLGQGGCVLKRWGGGGGGGGGLESLYELWQMGIETMTFQFHKILDLEKI